MLHAAEAQPGAAPDRGRKAVAAAVERIEAASSPLLVIGSGANRKMPRRSA